MYPRRIATRLAAALGGCAFAASLAAAPAAAPAASRKPAPAVARLHALFESAWERDLSDDPIAATYRGDTRYDDRWPDATRASLERIHAANAATLAELKAIPRARLLAGEQLSYDLFQRIYEERLALYRFHPEVYAITAREGIQALNENAELMRFATVADYEKWLKRLAALPVYLEHYTGLLREGASERRTQPRHLMERVLPQLAMQIVANPEDSPFYQRFRHFPDTIPVPERERLAAAARSVIAERVVPAHRRFEEFFRNEFLPACRETSGLWDTPDGIAYYESLVRHHTTTDLTPDRIHDLGLAEVARVRGEMQRLMEAIGFKGTLQEFFVKLRTDPQFYYKDPDELFRAYVVTAKQIEPELPRLFGRLYRTPFGVRPIPATSAPNTTTAYYNGPSEDGRRPG